jgi:hypothetical protein
MKVYNYQIAGLIQRLRRFRYESVKAASSGLAHVNEHDMRRAKSYLIAATSYIDWIVSQPQLDLPESTPREIDLGEAEKLDFPENESLLDLMRMYDLFEVEMGNSQSARLGDSLISHDEKRARDLIAKMEAFLDNYVAAILPMDLPESAPLREMTGPGRTGV